nr:MAG TPA: hypothetical protein [Caudoviricetes sp.]
MYIIYYIPYPIYIIMFELPLFYFNFIIKFYRQNP